MPSTSPPRLALPRARAALRERSGQQHFSGPEWQVRKPVLFSEAISVCTWNAFVQSAWCSLLCPESFPCGLRPPWTPVLYSSACSMACSIWVLLLIAVCGFHLPAQAERVSLFIKTPSSKSSLSQLRFPGLPEPRIKSTLKSHLLAPSCNSFLYGFLVCMQAL